MNINLYFLLIYCVYNSVAEHNECPRDSTCGECISNKNCVWCAADEMLYEKSRCLSLSAANTSKDWCKKEFVVNPETVNKVTLDKEFGEIKDNVTVQMRPHNIVVKARPGVPVPIKISYKPAKDYPLDVYYIMDISFTMKTIKEDLERQALEIYYQLTRNYTNNVRLGVGSFVEKPGYPYADIHKKNDTHIAYSFKSHLSLTDNIQKFKETMANIKFGANYDDPEAGLDALMQAMVCEKELGWRERSRRIIVLCTDSTYHSAGDGKVLGVIKPNDMKCHLDNNTNYSDKLALTYDYPSVSQINKVAKQGNFIIIFAATNVVQAEYTELSNQIMGAKYAFLQNGTDAVGLIKKAYEDSALRAELKHDNFPPFIELTLDQDCRTEPTRNCKSTPEQRTVTINGNLTVKYCPPDGKLKHNLEIKAVSINDIVNIELDVICKCDCEQPGGVLHAKCNNAGHLQCGICHCLSDRFGEDCLCDIKSSTYEDAKACKLSISDKAWCSKQGSCICGKCNCNDGYSGEFCQFSQNSCPTNCSHHGICYLGKCNCYSGWTKNDCSCTINTESCIAPYSKKLCSGNGECKCGKCECQQIAGKNESYSGRYCDFCDDCSVKRCKELEKYVICNVMKEKMLCDSEFNVTSTIVQFVNKSELNSPDWYMAKWCKTKLENDSSIIFKYQYEDGNLKLGIQNELELPAKANIFIAVGSAIGTVLLIGIITLIIWKILVDLHDKREYQRFSKESKAAGYDVSLNPLYTPPAANFNNPAYENN